MCLSKYIIYLNQFLELKKAFHFYVLPGKQTLDVRTYNHVLFKIKMAGTAKMGNFCKIFFFFNYSLLVKKGKIPLKMGPEGDGCHLG